MLLFGAGSPAPGEPLGNAQLRNAVQVRAAIGEQLAEVAVAHRLRVGAREVRTGVDLLPLVLVGDEEEQPVAVLGVAVAERQRTADVAARILIGALRLLRSRNAVGAVVGGELVVAPVVVGRAVELRAAGLGDAADAHAAGAVFRREVRALDLHLLNHVVVQRDDDAAVVADVHDRRAVERDRVARRADAVDRVALRVVAAGAEADRLALVELGDDAGQDAHQFERAAADDRQVVDLLGGEHTFTRAGLGLNDFELAGDRDGLRLLADFQPDVDAAVVVRAECQPLLFVGLEAGELDLQVVGAREQGAEQILAAVVGDRGLHGLGACVDGGDCCARKDPAARVLHRAANRRGGRSLSKCRGTRQQQCANCRTERHCRTTSGVPYSPERSNSTIGHQHPPEKRTTETGPSTKTLSPSGRKRRLRNRFRQQADGGNGYA